VRILIALASSPSQLSGVQRHAINLARCLLTRAEVTEVHLVAAPWQQGFVRDAFSAVDLRLHLHSAPIGAGASSRNLWFYLQLPRLARRLNADVVHLAYPVPLRRGAFHCPVVVTLHDLYPYDIPENFSALKVHVQRAILKQCLRSANAISCVSHTTLARLQKLDERLAHKASVVYNFVERPTPADAFAPPPEWKSHPFLLCVAQHRRNKNILFLLRVFESLLRYERIDSQTRLFIVGIPGPETPAIDAFIFASGLARRVVLLSGISDEQLQWCYRNCDVVLAPSIIEGFGLPLAEALLAGCRIVCSDIPAFRELGGTHCHYVPLGLGEVEAFLRAICAALSQQSPPPAAMPQLSALAIAAKYMQLYRSLLPPGIEPTDMHPAAYPFPDESRNLT
jgi:glycosyltransferase involved in cell wall biosynthesis